MDSDLPQAPLRAPALSMWIASGLLPCHTTSQVPMNLLVLLALAYFATVFLVAQHRAPDAYSPRRHTISQLAAQGYDGRRLMQLGFALYGAVFTTALLWTMWQSDAPVYRDLPHLVYGLALLPTGAFSTVPFTRTPRVSRREARLHALFAQVAGGAFGIGILVHATIYPAEPGRVFHVLSGTLYAVVAVWFVLTRVSKGLAQRILYGYGSVWLLATYGSGLFLASG